MDRFNFAQASAVPSKQGTRGRTATLINMWRVQGVGKVAPKAMPDGAAGAVEAPAPPMVCVLVLVCWCAATAWP